MILFETSVQWKMFQLPAKLGKCLITSQTTFQIQYFRANSSHWFLAAIYPRNFNPQFKFYPEHQNFNFPTNFSHKTNMTQLLPQCFTQKSSWTSKHRLLSYKVPHKLQNYILNSCKQNKNLTSIKKFKWK